MEDGHSTPDVYSFLSWQAPFKAPHLNTSRMLGEEPLAGVSLKIKDVLELICKYAEIDREALSWTLYTLSKATRGSMVFTAGALSITLEKWLDQSTITVKLQRENIEHTITYRIDFRLAASLLEEQPQSKTRQQKAEKAPKHSNQAQKQQHTTEK